MSHDTNAISCAYCGASDCDVRHHVEEYLEARHPDWDDMSVAERQVMLDECMS